MDELTQRKLNAYKVYLQRKYKDEVVSILEKTNSMDVADKKIEQTLEKYDNAWDQISKYYHCDEDDDE